MKLATSPVSRPRGPPNGRLLASAPCPFNVSLCAGQFQYAYGASSLCWPRLHFDLPNQILRFRPPKCGRNRSAPQTPSKNAIKYICKKGTFFGGVRMCCTLWLSTPVPPKGHSSTPGVLQGYPLKWKHMGDNAIRRSPQCDSAPRSDRLLLRRDLIFELLNTVVSEVRKHACSARS